MNVGGLASSVLFIFTLLIVPFIITLFIKGIGSFKYPILVYEGSNSTSLIPLKDEFHFITIGQYLGKTVILVLFALFFVYSLYFLISLFVKGPAVSFGLTSVLVLGGIILLPKFWFNPFLYVDTHQIINGATSTLAFNDAINYTSGLVTLFIFGALAIALSYIKFVRGVH